MKNQNEIGFVFTEIVSEISHGDLDGFHGTFLLWGDEGCLDGVGGQFNGGFQWALLGEGY